MQGNRLYIGDAASVPIVLKAVPVATAISPFAHWANLAEYVTKVVKGRISQLTCVKGGVRFVDVSTGCIWIQVWKASHGRELKPEQPLRPCVTQRFSD